MLELRIQFLCQHFFHFFLSQCGYFLILYTLDMNLRVGFLNETDLENVVAVGDNRCNLKESSHLTGIVAEEIIHSALNAGDETNAVPHFTGAAIANRIVDQWKIGLI